MSRYLLRWYIDACYEQTMIDSVIDGWVVVTDFDTAANQITIQTKDEFDLAKMPYPEYLLTEHWLGVRERALVRAGRRCQVCNADRDLQVHHRTYENRGNELDADVTVLCRSCHMRFHDILPEAT
jgi:hypothetical protein